MFHPKNKYQQLIFYRYFILFLSPSQEPTAWDVDEEPNIPFSVICVFLLQENILFQPKS